MPVEDGAGAVPSCGLLIASFWCVRSRGGQDKSSPTCDGRHEAKDRSERPSAGRLDEGQRQSKSRKLL